MSCADRDDLLNALVDGQLAGEARAEAEAHLRACDGCRAAFDALQAQHRELEAAFAPDRRRADRFAERLASRFGRPGWGARALQIAGTLAAGVLLGVFLRPAAPPPPPPPATADARERAAWEALQQVHALGHRNPLDRAAFVAGCFEIEKKHPGTAAAEAAKHASAAFAVHVCAGPGDEKAVVAELRRRLDEAVAAAQADLRLRDEVDRELARLDEALAAPSAREQFAELFRRLEEARPRRAEPRWTSEIDRRRTLAEARLAEQGGACAALAKAAEPAEARRQRERVAAWGLPDALTRFDREVGAIPEPPKEKEPPKDAPPAPPPSVLVQAVVGKMMVKGPEPKAGERLPLPAFLATQEDALCSLQTAAGDVVRMNGDTHLELARDGGLVLRRGELFVRGAAALHAGGRTVAAKGAAFEVSVRDTAGQVKGPGRRILRVTLLRGELAVDGKAVAPGETLRIVDGRPEPAGPAEEVGLAAAWMLPLLRLRAEDAAELQQRAEALVLQVDDPRFGKASELGLRRMGADAAPPLLRVLGQVKGVDAALRRKAAALLADLAGPEQASSLVDLLRDREPEVRAQAARGLERLTGQTLGQPRTVWSGSGYERGAQAWETWIERNTPAWGAPVPRK